MKKLIILSMFLASSVAYSSDPVCNSSTGESEVKEQFEIKTDVPNYLKGATITVRLSNGKETTVPAERFKVVPRKQQFIVTKLETDTVTTCTQNASRPNRVSVLGGRGAQGGLTNPSSVNPTTVEVESKVGLVGGLQYQRLLPVLDDRLSIGVQAQTSKTGSVLLGIDF